MAAKRKDTHRQRVIRVRGKDFVAGFSEEHQIVQLTADPGRAKRFSSPLAARAFIGTYGNKGYGLGKLDAVVALPCSVDHKQLGAGCSCSCGYATVALTDRGEAVPHGPHCYCANCKARYRAKGAQLKPTRVEAPGLGGKPIDQMSDVEVRNYIAFVLESWAHMQGHMGALSPAQLLKFAERLRGETGKAGPGKPLWRKPSKVHAPFVYTVHYNSDPKMGTPEHPGVNAYLGADLIGWAPTVSDARDLVAEWEDRG